MLPSPWHPWLVLGTIALTIFLLYKEYVRPALTFFLAVIVLLAAGVLTTGEVLAGFSNESIATIVLLVVLTATLRKNYTLEALLDRLFRRANTVRSFLWQMTISMALFSSILNNTPIVAMMTPYVYQWGQQHRVPPSRLLIPLSYATMLGGMITLIGTSTNLVLNGFLAQSGEPLLTFADFFPLGVLVSITGILYLILFGYRLLPRNMDALTDLKANAREYLVETQIVNGSPLVGKTVSGAGLRNLRGVYLVEIDRNGETISPVAPDETLHHGDLLLFAGNTDTVVDLINADNGLVPHQGSTQATEGLEVCEAVIPANSALAGRIVRESDFRSRYRAAIVAVHRNGERLRGKIGNLRLQSGDLLLLSAGPDFRRNLRQHRDLYVISRFDDPHQARKNPRRRLFLPVLGGVVALLVVGVVPLFAALLMLLGAAFGLRMLTLEDVKKEVDISMVGVLVFSLALGSALIKTGAADLIAGVFMQGVSPLGTVGLVTGLFVLTVVLTSFVTNVAAVSIAFPIAYALGHETGLPHTALYLTVAFAASCAFLTPIGYQTNLMVYGPGGYTFRDFFRVGLPLVVIYFATCMAYLFGRYPLL
ncbi:MAG: SLC13 family permease [Catalinimonas sp.]